MRRTKAQGLHPATQTAAHALSNYLSPGDPAGVVRFAVPSPLDSPWDNVPIDPFPEILASAKLYDFRDTNDLTNVWAQFKDDSATVFALQNRKGGGVTFDTGNLDGQSYNFAETANDTFAFESGKQTWSEFRYNAYPKDGLVSQSIFGFGDGYSLNEDEAFFDSPNNEVAFSVTNGQYLIMYINIDGEIAYNEIMDEELPIDTTDGNMHDLGIHFEPNKNTPGTHDVYLFADGEFVLSRHGLTLPTAPMGVYVGSQSHRDRVQLEHVFVIQED